MSLMSLFAAFALGVQLVAGVAVPRDKALPTVDVDTAIYQPSYDTKSDLYYFNNIRYAEAPVGNLRWQPPVPARKTNRTTIPDSPAKICPQGYPQWSLEAKAAKANTTADKLQMFLMSNPLMDEDCLSVRVVVPPKVLENGSKKPRKEKLAPVMVWIFGGGYTSGSHSDDQFNPTGLINASRVYDGEPIVYCAINYRLGALGWLNAGPYSGILANVALHDQKLGLEWIKNYVSRFGGDPERITVFGQSAGGGSIMHHLTAYGGQGKKSRAPFQQAILQSPGWAPTPDTPLGWKKLLDAASNVTGRGITDAKGLRGLTSKELIKANQMVIYGGPYGSFTYGPSVDGGYVPDMPGALLQQGKFDKHVRILTGHNSNETVPFTPVIGATSTLFKGAAYGVSEKNQEYILTKLYPPVSPTLDKNEYWYTSEFGRSVFLSSEWSFTCNTRWLGVAYGKDGECHESYSYRFEVPPGWHGQDISYTFWNGQGLADGIVADVARPLQRSLVEFARRGTPNAVGLPKWPTYQSGGGHTIMAFGINGIKVTEDKLANKRCEYWQSGEYQDLV